MDEKNKNSVWLLQKRVIRYGNQTIRYNSYLITGVYSVNTVIIPVFNN
ncbi:hypothetical protein HNP38_000819 [Chryseobacterium defluvii]|uniref:Uncharacterized protein n=1 Tax=Chryseobacterium defluvii TaxID=160396 RepID=A0A840KC15_9FLAO|nr:hypothetical protein [Chryseobacterium defluvii]